MFAGRNTFVSHINYLFSPTALAQSKLLDKVSCVPGMKYVCLTHQLLVFVFNIGTVQVTREGVMCSRDEGSEVHDSQ